MYHSHHNKNFCLKIAHKEDLNFMGLWTFPHVFEQLEKERTSHFPPLIYVLSSTSKKAGKSVGLHSNCNFKSKRTYPAWVLGNSRVDEKRLSPRSGRYYCPPLHERTRPNHEWILRALCQSYKQICVQFRSSLARTVEKHKQKLSRFAPNRREKTKHEAGVGRLILQDKRCSYLKLNPPREPWFL